MYVLVITASNPLLITYYLSNQDLVLNNHPLHHTKFVDGAIEVIRMFVYLIVCVCSRWSSTVSQADLCNKIVETCHQNFPRGALDSNLNISVTDLLFMNMFYVCLAFENSNIAEKYFEYMI